MRGKLEAPGFRLKYFNVFIFYHYIFGHIYRAVEDEKEMVLISAVDLRSKAAGYFFAFGRALQAIELHSLVRILFAFSLTGMTSFIIGK